MEEKDLEHPVSPGAPGEEPSAPQEGRRLDPSHRSGRWKLPVLIVGVAAAVLLAGYLALCAVASNGGFLPNTYMAGVDIGGMSPQQAVEAVTAAANSRYETMEIPISVGGKGLTLSAQKAGVTLDASAAAEELQARSHPSFLTAGGKYLAGRFGRVTELPAPMKVENGDYVARVLDEAARLAGDGVTETTWDIEEDEETARLTLTCGRTGRTVDGADLAQRVQTALLTGSTAPIEATIVTTPPQVPDFEKMAADVAREPLDAALDLETDEVIPHRLGVKLDPAKAKAAYDALEEGESGQVELEVTQPDVTTLELRATLFRDILGEGSSKITGDAARVNNVRLSAAACDGVVLLPGQQMSYNQTTGQRTTAKGYREATGYTSKGQELMVGGGVCQPSSTLYMACLHANLEIVNRKNHMYTVSYMPEGIDATVSWPNLDYVFANNTKYPIKVSMTIENRVLTARIYGTKTDDTYVKMESVRLSTTPAGVSYQADPEIPRGTTTVVQGAHTGKKVEVYKSTYAADGTLLSREWVSTDTYRPSDKIIGYNPLDGVPEAGIAPQPDPNAPVTPPETPAEPPAQPTVQPTEPPAQPVQPTPPPAVPTQPVEEPGIPTEEPEASPTPPPVDISLLPPDGLPQE